MSTPANSSTLLTTREAARRLGLASGTLCNWRSRGQGPAAIHLGRAVRYDEADLVRFIAQGRAEIPARGLRPAPTGGQGDER